MTPATTMLKQPPPVTIGVKHIATSATRWESTKLKQNMRLAFRLASAGGYASAREFGEQVWAR